MAIRYYLLILLCFNLLYAKENPPPPNNPNTDSPTPIQDKVLKTDTTPYKTLDKVFPSDYLEGVMNGFISSIENVLLKVDIRRISLDFSNTSINVSQEYIDESINQFSGDSSTIIGFNADLALDYNFTNSRFSNRLFMEYGLILLRPKSGDRTRTETADNIIFTSGYTSKTFMLKNGFVGPFIDGEYQTEFTKNTDGSKNQALRYKNGIRMLDGKYIDEMYLAGVGEIDFSVKPHSIRGALETGIRAKSPITDNIGMVYQAFWRQYIGYTKYRNRDLQYNANISVRLDVSIYKGFAFSPFISARFAKIKGSNKHGSNIMTGISLLFSTSINAISSIQSTQNNNLKEYYKSIDN